MHEKVTETNVHPVSAPPLFFFFETDVFGPWKELSNAVDMRSYENDFFKKLLLLGHKWENKRL